MIGASVSDTGQTQRAAECAYASGNRRLSREEWDFSEVPMQELKTALAWEVVRECSDVPGVVARAESWLDAEVPDQPSSKALGGCRRTRNSGMKRDEWDTARAQACAVFGEFLPSGDFLSRVLHKWTAAQYRAEYLCFLAKHLRPLIKNYSIPWLRLPQRERKRLRVYFEGSRLRLVSIARWSEALWAFNRTKPDPGSPLAFESQDHTNVLLTIRWGPSKTRIMAAIKKIIDECEPQGIRRWNARGRKHRDVLVALERIGIMRLLHHFTLAEIPNNVPEAWKLYKTRKWYAERQRALRNFREARLYAKPENVFPASWVTKAKRRQTTAKLPTK